MAKSYIPVILVTLMMVGCNVKPLAAQDGRAGDGRKEIAAVRYAPPGRYMKDHCFMIRDGLVHLYAPLGRLGTSWEDPGSEETAEHMVSRDLINWEHVGTAVPASGQDGHFDKMMGGIAPTVIEHQGKYYMFYSGWTFPSKRPNFDMSNYRQSVGVAVSSDLYNWEKPAEFARDGLGVSGTDPGVVYDEPNNRWLMYTCSDKVTVFQSSDLLHWSEAGIALSTEDLKGGKTSGNPAESPCVLRHPLSGRWVIVVNGGYSLSDDPLRFPPVRPFPFKSGWHGNIEGVKASGLWGDGTNCQADDDGAGFAHEVLEYGGQWYLTGVVGRDGQFRLRFTPIEWTADALKPADW